MGARTQAAKTIEDTRQLQALVSPVRQEVFDTLDASGPCSAADLAGQLGRAADSLYFHLRMLERVGLITSRGRDIGRGRTEAVYQTAAKAMRLAYDSQAPSQTTIVVKMIGGMLRITKRDLEAALMSGGVRTRGKRRNFVAGRLKAWLTARQVQDVNEHIEAITKIMRDGERSGGGSLHALTIALTPIHPSERAPNETGES